MTRPILFQVPNSQWPIKPLYRCLISTPSATSNEPMLTMAIEEPDEIVLTGTEEVEYIILEKRWTVECL